jgi:hypothetical protein
MFHIFSLVILASGAKDTQKKQETNCVETTQVASGQ